jgi:dihydrofolate reductase
MLPGRDNVVITSKAQERFKTFQKLYPDAVNGPAFVDSLDEAIRYAQFVHPKKDIYVIGGSKIYALALDSGKVDEIILSLVDGEYTGDTYFPQISDDYFIESNVLHEQFSVVTYKKYSRYYSNL